MSPDAFVDFVRLLTIAFSVAAAAGVAVAQRGAPPVTLPGSMGGGETLLPNGWRIAPAGRHMAIGDLPLNEVLSPDGRYLIVSNNGYAKPTLRVVDLERGVVSQTVALDDAWLGLAWSPDGTKLYSSGAAANSVNELAWRNGRLTRTGTLPLGRSARETIEGSPHQNVPQSFVGGISVSPDGTRLVAAHVLGEAISLVELHDGRRARHRGCPGRTVHDALFQGRIDGVRLAVGRRARPAARSEDARRQGRDRRRRASERDGAGRRTGGCSSLARTRTPSGSSIPPR